MKFLLNKSAVNGDTYMSSYGFSVLDTVGAKAKSKLVAIVIYRNNTGSPIDNSDTVIEAGQYIHSTLTLSVISGSYTITPLVVGGVTLQPTTYTLLYQSGMNAPILYTGLGPKDGAYFTILGVNGYYYMVRNDLTSKPPPEECCQI